MLRLWRGNRLAHVVYALQIQPGTTRRGYAPNRADASHRATYATTGRAHLTSGATFTAREADAIGRTTGVPRAADLAPWAADTLPGAELLGLTAHAVTWRADLPALAGAVDLAATAILDDLVARSFTQRVAGFRTALLGLPPPVMIGVMAPSAAATTDDGPITVAASVKCDGWIEDRRGEAECGSPRGAKSAQRQPARGSGAEGLRQTAEPIRIHARAGCLAAYRHPATSVAGEMRGIDSGLPAWRIACVRNGACAARSGRDVGPQGQRSTQRRWRP
jgi:hypothetical protein